MSSSDGEAKRWGTIYMGPGPMDEATITDLEYPFHSFEACCSIAE